VREYERLKWNMGEMSGECEEETYRKSGRGTVGTYVHCCNAEEALEPRLRAVALVALPKTTSQPPRNYIDWYVGTHFTLRQEGRSDDPTTARVEDRKSTKRMK